MCLNLKNETRERRCLVNLFSMFVRKKRAFTFFGVSLLRELFWLGGMSYGILRISFAFPTRFSSKESFDFVYLCAWAKRLLAFLSTFYISVVKSWLISSKDRSLSPIRKVVCLILSQFSILDIFPSLIGDI